MNHEKLREEFEDRFVPEPLSGCWIWIGTTHHSGYGVMTCKIGNKKRQERAHRISFFLHNGKRPGKKFVLHKCDNRACVNTSHLYLGDHDQNMKDMVLRGRADGNRGEKNGRAVLDEGSVRKIRSARSAGLSFAKIADEFKVHKNTVYGICTGIKWKHVK